MKEGTLQGITHKSLHCYEQFYAIKLAQKKNEHIPRTYSIPRLNNGETENLKRTITSKDVESVTSNLSKNKNPRPESFTCDFYQIFKEALK